MMAMTQTITQIATVTRACGRGIHFDFERLTCGCWDGNSTRCGLSLAIAATALISLWFVPWAGRRHFDAHPVIGGLDIRRQARPQHLVIEVGVHVGQDRALRLDSL